MVSNLGVLLRMHRNTILVVVCLVGLVLTIAAPFRQPRQQDSRPAGPHRREPVIAPDLDAFPEGQRVGNREGFIHERLQRRSTRPGRDNKPPPFAGDKKNQNQDQNSVPRVANDSRVVMRVFEESKCPDTQRFFNKLNGAWPRIRHVVKLELLPHGKPVHHDGVRGCQHGESECLGNLAHLCVARHAHQDQALAYVHCLFQSMGKISKSGLPQLHRKCLDKSGVTSSPQSDLAGLDACYSGRQFSSEIRADMQRIDGQYGVEFSPKQPLKMIPTIHFADRPQRRFHSLSPDRIVEEVCKAYPGPLPCPDNTLN